MGKRLTKKQIRKRIDKKCKFCDCQDYDLLDVHRILPGEQGGKYIESNMVTVCCMCHRKIHAGKIVVLGRYYSTRGELIHYIDEDGNEQYA